MRHGHGAKIGLLKTLLYQEVVVYIYGNGYTRLDCVALNRQTLDASKQGSIDHNPNHDHKPSL